MSTFDSCSLCTMRRAKEWLPHGFQLNIWTGFLCKSLLVLAENGKRLGRLGIGVKEIPQHNVPEYLKRFPPNQLSDVAFTFLAGWLSSLQFLHMLGHWERKPFSLSYTLCRRTNRGQVKMTSSCARGNLDFTLGKISSQQGCQTLE